MRDSHAAQIGLLQNKMRALEARVAAGEARAQRERAQAQTQAQGGARRGPSPRSSRSRIVHTRGTGASPPPKRDSRAEAGAQPPRIQNTSPCTQKKARQKTPRGKPRAQRSARGSPRPGKLYRSGDSRGLAQTSPRKPSQAQTRLRRPESRGCAEEGLSPEMSQNQRKLLGQRRLFLRQTSALGESLDQLRCARPQEGKPGPGISVLGPPRKRHLKRKSFPAHFGKARKPTLASKIALRQGVRRSGKARLPRKKLAIQKMFPRRRGEQAGGPSPEVRAKVG